MTRTDGPRQANGQLIDGRTIVTQLIDPLVVLLLLLTQASRQWPIGQTVDIEVTNPRQPDQAHWTVSQTQ